MKQLAHAFMATLRAQPLPLVLVATNLMLVLGGGYAVSDIAAAVRTREARTAEQIDRLLNQCLPRSSTQ